MSIMETRFINRLLGVTVLVVGILGGGCHKDISDEDVVRLSPVEINKRLNKDSLVLDMRDRTMFDQGHLPFARLGRLADVDPTSEDPRYPGYSLIVVYGQHAGPGVAASMAKRLMINRNDNVRLMEGGYDEWVRLGLPIDLSAPRGE